MDEAALELQSLRDLADDIAMFTTDFDRNQAHLSPTLCVMLGLPVGTKLTLAQAGRIFDARDHPAVQMSAEAASRSVNRGKWSGIFRVRRADAAPRRVYIQGKQFYRDTPQGLEPVRSVGVVVDVTDLKVDASLHETEGRLELALEAGQMGIFEIDIAAGRAVIDAQEARLLGLPEKTSVLSVDELRKYLPVEDVLDLVASDQPMRIRPFSHEFRVRLSDGTERWLRTHANVKHKRIFGVNLDITKRKVAEVALEDSEARLRIATSGAALGVFEWNPATGQAIWENERTNEIFGRNRADGPLGKRQFLNEYLHPDDAPAFNVALNEARKTGGVFHVICRIRSKSGAKCWLQIGGKFEPGTASKAARIVGIVADVTAHKRLEARAKLLSEQLLTIQEEERRSIAQELHDSTVQHLVAADLGLATLLPHVGRKGQKAWNGVEESLAEAMNELRTFSYLMHPPTLRRQGLHHSLQQYIDGFADRTRIACTFRTNNDKLPQRVQRAVFRIVQEALANVYRHASASKASIELRRVGAHLQLIVTDNGRGIDTRREPHKPRRPGIGIRGIRLRLNQLGGRLRISRPQTGGTRIHAVLPLSTRVVRLKSDDDTLNRKISRAGRGQQ
jgi:signal transduction histidine kinase